MVVFQFINHFLIQILMSSIFAGLFSFLLATSTSFPALAECPSADKIKTHLERLTQTKVDVLSVQPSGMPPLCEAAVRSESTTKIVTYVNPAAETITGFTILLSRHSASPATRP